MTFVVAAAAGPATKTTTITITSIATIETI